MAITVKDTETFQWTTNPALLTRRWSSTANLTAIGAPGPFGTGSYLRMAANGLLDTTAWLKTGSLMVEFSLNIANMTGTELVNLQVDNVNVAFTLGVSAGGQLYLDNLHLGLIQFPANLVIGNWYRIQWTILFGNPGISYIWVNGNEITGGYTGNFRYFADYTPVTFMRFRYRNQPNTDWSNMVWGFITNALTDKFPADQRAVCLLPSADSAVTWTPTGALTNTLCLTQAAEPDDDVTYNASAVPGNQDLFDIVPPGLGGSINITNMKVISRKDDAGAQFITPTLLTNAATVQGPSTGQGASYQACPFDAWPGLTNPVTGVAFTSGEIDLIKIGYRNAS